MNCPNCDHPLTGEETLCPLCGATIDVPVQAEPDELIGIRSPHSDDGADTEMLLQYREASLKSLMWSPLSVIFAIVMSNISLITLFNTVPFFTMLFQNPPDISTMAADEALVNGFVILTMAMLVLGMVFLLMGSWMIVGGTFSATVGTIGCSLMKVGLNLTAVTAIDTVVIVLMAVNGISGMLVQRTGLPIYRFTASADPLTAVIVFTAMMLVFVITLFMAAGLYGKFKQLTRTVAKDAPYRIHTAGIGTAVWSLLLTVIMVMVMINEGNISYLTICLTTAPALMGGFAVMYAVTSRNIKEATEDLNH